MLKILCPLALAAQQVPTRTAVITDERRYNYSELEQVVADLCAHLQSLGVEAGQRIAFIAQTDLPTIALFFALFRQAAVACPISFRQPSAQIPALLERLSAHAFVDPSTWHIDTQKRCATPNILIEETLATMLFTSGSSGIPKIACHRLESHLYSARGSIEALELTSDSLWQLSLPLFHVGGIGILFRTFLAQSAILLSKRNLSEILEEYPVTHLSLVPTQLYRLLQTEQTPKHLRCILLGGAPISQMLFEEGVKRGLPLCPTYGMTEMSSLITLSKGQQTLSGGKPLPYRELKISEEGEILVRGQTLFAGYWDETKQVPVLALNDGWFATRDTGRLDAEGNLVAVGRKDRLFISGGENISPEEIEQALLDIPGITAAVVVPQPDKEFGARPAAFVRDDTGSHNLNTVRTHLAAHLPSFKHPVRLLPLPDTPGLKPNLKELQKLLEN